MPATDADREGYPYKLGVAEQEIKQIREALASSERKNARLEHENRVFRQANERLKDALDEARDALAFYANPDNYKGLPPGYAFVPIDKDSGASARSVLNED